MIGDVVGGDVELIGPRAHLKWHAPKPYSHVGGQPKDERRCREWTRFTGLGVAIRHNKERQGGKGERKRGKERKRKMIRRKKDDKETDRERKKDERKKERERKRKKREKSREIKNRKKERQEESKR